MAKRPRVHHRLNITTRAVARRSNPESASCQAGVVHKTNHVCCNATCGLCGGRGCSTAPGGRLQCCMPAILRSRRICHVWSDVACILHRPAQGNEAVNNLTTAPLALVHPKNPASKAQLDTPCASVVTSDARYVRPLSILLRSLHAANVPHAVLVTSDLKHAGADVFRNRHEEGVRLSEIRTRDSNYEYLGFQKLQQHLNQSFLTHRCFVMLHDTCEVSPGFGKLTMRSFGDKHHVLVGNGWTSNIMAITALGVPQLRIRKYKTKMAAVYGEFRREVLQVFAKDRIGQIATREGKGLRDVYRTGLPRTVYFYPDLHVFKYVYKPPVPWQTAGENARLRAQTYRRRVGLRMQTNKTVKDAHWQWREACGAGSRWHAGRCEGRGETTMRD